jgi:hypothetical protein
MIEFGLAFAAAPPIVAAQYFGRLGSTQNDGPGFVEGGWELVSPAQPADEESSEHWSATAGAIVNKTTPAANSCVPRRPQIHRILAQSGFAILTPSPSAYSSECQTPAYHQPSVRFRASSALSYAARQLTSQPITLAASPTIYGFRSP